MRSQTKWFAGVAVSLLAIGSAYAWQQQGVSSHSGTLAQQWTSQYISKVPPSGGIPSSPLQMSDASAALAYIELVFDHVAENVKMHIYFHGEFEARLVALETYFSQTNQDETELRDLISAYGSAVGALDQELQDQILYRDSSVIMFNSESQFDREAALVNLEGVLEWSKDAVSVTIGPNGYVFANETLRHVVELLEDVDDWLLDREANKSLQTAYIMAGATI